jgi:hypothetical protein
MFACLATACSSKPAQPETSQPALTAPANAAPNGPPTKLNMDEIFPPGPGREILLNNCTTCHTFVPIVLSQKTKEEWENTRLHHRDRVSGLGDADFKTLYEYLETNFARGHPVPKLPPELLQTWTSY